MGTGYLLSPYSAHGISFSLTPKKSVNCKRQNVVQTCSLLSSKIKDPDSNPKITPVSRLTSEKKK